MIQPYYMNREFSWIGFNTRVLEEAEDPNIPLLEQLSFSAIYQSNLDEFVQVRVGTMLDRMKEKPNEKDSRSGLKPKEQLKEMLSQIQELVPRKDRAYLRTMERLKEYGIVHVTFADTTPEERDYLEKYFKMEVRPLLSPIVIEKHQPFPFLKNKALYVAVQLAAKSGVKMGIIQVSLQAGRVIRLNKSGRFILLEDLIMHFAPQAFKSYKVIDAAVLRVTRNGAIQFSDSAADEYTDFKDIMEELIQKRKKREAVRLQMNSAMSPEMWVSTLRRPILSPPGFANQAWPKRARRGPTTMTDPLKAAHFLTNSSVSI